MNAQLDFSQAPFRYLICLNRKCTQATICLRQLVEATIPADLESWTIVSPKYLAAQKGECPLYRPANKVHLAKGFIGILENLPYKQMLNVVSCLRDYFGERTYYRVRCGERLLSPAEQTIILNLLKKCGVTNPQDFDAYIESYDW